MRRRVGDAVHETSSFSDAWSAADNYVARTGNKVRVIACTLPEGGRGFRVWGYAS